MKKYLIALDMDGTLLNSEREISEATKSYLRELQAFGHQIVIASGRPYRAIKRYYEEIGLKSPVICYNGAYIFSPSLSYFPSRENRFEISAIQKLIEKVGLNHFENIMCETNTDIYLLDKEDNLASFFWHEGMNIHYGDVSKTLDSQPFTMIMIMKDHSQDDLLYKIAAEIGYQLRFWGGDCELFCELYMSTVDKSQGIKYLANYYNIPLSQTIAFGDADNDVEMISDVAIGVAMENGQDNIKEIADLISDGTNDEDGIMKTLKKILQDN